MHPLITFYTGLQKHPDSGLSFEEILLQPNEYWEHCHTHIQFLFPLPEPSRFHPETPTAIPEVYQTFKDTPALKSKLVQAVNRYLQFLRETHDWITEGNHNHFRITRVLRCLTLCGMSSEAEQFRTALSLSMWHHSVKHASGISTFSTPYWKKTLEYWAEAQNEHPAWL